MDGQHRKRRTDAASGAPRLQVEPIRDSSRKTAEPVRLCPAPGNPREACRSGSVDLGPVGHPSYRESIIQPIILLILYPKYPVQSASEEDLRRKSRNNVAERTSLLFILLLTVR